MRRIGLTTLAFASLAAVAAWVEATKHSDRGATRCEVGVIRDDNSPVAKQPQSSADHPSGSAGGESPPAQPRPRPADGRYFVPEEREAVTLLEKYNVQFGAGDRGHVIGVTVPKPPPGVTYGQILEQVAKFSEVEDLGLTDAKLGADDLRKIAGLQHLARLYLSGAKISPDAFPVLGSMESVQTLWLNGSTVDGAGLKKLGGLKNLLHLYLYRTVVDDDGLTAISGFTHLRSLSLDNTKITNRGLRALEALTDLETLDLSLWLNDEGVSHLENLTRLTELQDTAPFRDVTDKGLRSLRKLTRLRTLSMMGSQMTNQGLACLEGMKQLQWLDISHTRVTEAGLGTLLSLPELRVLSLGPGISKKGMAIIAKIPKLISLTVSVTDDDALVPLREMPNLGLLDLSGSHLSDAGLVHLVQLSKLEELGLDYMPVGDGSIQHLAKLTQLKRLGITRTKFSEQGRAKLHAALPKTELMDLDNDVMNY